jgi:hypothetical protein
MHNPHVILYKDILKFIKYNNSIGKVGYLFGIYEEDTTRPELILGFYLIILISIKDKVIMEFNKKI